MLNTTMEISIPFVRMIVSEGDIIRTIRQNIAKIGHFHTADNPGRNDVNRRERQTFRRLFYSLDIPEPTDRHCRVL